MAQSTSIILCILDTGFRLAFSSIAITISSLITRVAIVYIIPASLTLFNCPSTVHSFFNMPELSTSIACNGSNAVEAETATSITGLPNDHSCSYSLNRFLTEPSHTPGYAPAQTPDEARKRMLEELRTFETKFLSNGDDLQRS
ncbi:hypothetical protein HDV62DRAFT_395598 [Trichoderma sp. SZMC 28011]